MTLFLGPAQAIGASESQPVIVVVGPNAPALETFAAQQLCEYLDKLFDVKVRPTTTVPNHFRNAFRPGSPDTKPQIKREDFPGVSDQGVVLKAIQRKRNDDCWWW